MSTRVYIGRLPWDCRERDLEKFFDGYGRIRDILIKNGFAFVDFSDPRDADDAVFELNGRRLLGEMVTLEIARGARRGNSSGFDSRRKGNWLDKYGPPTRTENRLIVENLSSKVSWQDLKDFMRSAGEVTYADAHKQKKNEGVVEFATYSDMKNAYHKLDNIELSGRRIRLIIERPHRSSRRSRSRSSSRSRSHSPSRSRSRSRERSARKSHSRSRSPSSAKSASRSPSPKNATARSRERSASSSSSRGGAE